MKKKKIIMLCAAVAAVIAIAAIAGLISGLSRKKSPVADDSSEYSYTVENSGRSLIIRIKGGSGDGYEWKPVGYSEDIVNVSGHGNRITVSPVSFGDTVLCLSLEREGTPIPDRKYAIYVSLNVDVDLNLSASSSYVNDSETVFSAEGSPIAYAFILKNDFTVQFAVSAESPENILTECSDASLLSISRTDCEGYVMIEASQTNAGQCGFTLSDTSKNKAVEILLSKDEGSSVSVISHNVSDYNSNSRAVSEEEKEAVKYVGKIVFPDGFVPEKCKITELSENKHVVRYDITSGTDELDFAISCDISLADLREHYKKAEIRAEQQIKLGSYDAIYYESEDVSYVAWNTQSGASCLLYSQSSGVREAAEKMAAANPSPSVG